MSAKPDLWMPFYIADYLADTQHLSTEEHGAYILLLMAAWMRGGALPADDTQLMRISRLDKARWKRVKQTISEFFEVTDQQWIQPRLADEYEHAVKVNNAQKANGKKGGRPKLNKTQEKPMGFDSVNPNHNPIETPPQSQPQLKPSELTHSKETNTSNNPSPAASVCLAIKQQGIADVNPASPTLLALLDAGAGIDEFSYAASAAASKGKRSFSYVLGIVKKQREDAARMVLHKGAMPVAPPRNQSVHDKRTATARAMFGDLTDGNHKPRIIDVSSDSATGDRPLISSNG